MRNPKAYSAPVTHGRPSGTIEIAVDGGPRVGYGHIGRCLALWEELGKRAAFRVEDPVAAQYVVAQGASVGRRENPRVVVLDRSTPTGVDEVLRLQRTGRRVCLVDDPGDGRRLANLVVDPPTGRAWPSTGGRRLGGFSHVLLRRAICNATPAGSDWPYVLVGLGGSDPANLTRVLAHALSDAAIDTVVALGPGYRGECPRTGTVLRDSDAWPMALAGARIAVTGFGHSLLEAAYLGVPAVAVVFQPGHREDARAFCQNGTAIFIDMTSGSRPDELAREVGSLLVDDERRTAMSRRGHELIDGQGAARVAIALEELL